eukprot:10296-Heterococcus_DN1.PRE.1
MHSSSSSSSSSSSASVMHAAISAVAVIVQRQFALPTACATVNARSFSGSWYAEVDASLQQVLLSCLMR